ncbi:MAG: hypothetical protein U9N52_09230 [Campylobacterota bacterium]|nr:hypothetical protein [Campylobacterota bacterium]
MGIDYAKFLSGTDEEIGPYYDEGYFGLPDLLEKADFLICSISQYNQGVFSASCRSSEYGYDVSLSFALDSEVNPAKFQTVEAHMTDTDGSSVKANFKNIPLNLSGIEVDKDGYVSLLKDSIHGDVGSTFCNYVQDLSGFYFVGKDGPRPLQSYDCSQGGTIFIEMSMQ